MKDHYERLYATSGTYWGVDPSPISLILLRHRSSGALLDLGCGQGPDALFFAKKGFSVTAIDISPKAIADLLSQANHLPIRALVGDMHTLPKENFSVVFSRMSLQMIVPNKRLEYINTLKETYPGALHCHIVPVSGACFGDAFICSDDLLSRGYSDWEILFSEIAWTLSRVPNENGEPYLMREARLIGRKRE